MGVVTEFCIFLPKNVKCRDTFNEAYIGEMYDIECAKKIFDSFPKQYVYYKRIQLVNEQFYLFDTYIEWCVDRQDHCYYRKDNDQFVSTLKPHHYQLKKVRHINYKIKQEFKGSYKKKLFKKYIDVGNIIIQANVELNALKHYYVSDSPIKTWELNKNNFIHISW